MPADSQRIEVSAQPADGVTLVQVTLRVDGQPIAALREPPYRAWWRLAAGSHRFTATGLDAEGRHLSSDPVDITVSD
jgi:hypothetical protein